MYKRQVKETIANVNVPVVCAGAYIKPGDIIVADDDGVVVVEQSRGEEVHEKVLKRVANEEDKRKRLASGELGLDIYAMRERLAAKGLTYIKQSEDK